MLLQDSQGEHPNLSKNRCRINIPIVAWEYKRNIQPISQCSRKDNSDILLHCKYHTTWASQRIPHLIEGWCHRIPLEKNLFYFQKPKLVKFGP